VYHDLELVKLLVTAGANVNQRATGRFFLPEDQKNGLKKFTDYNGEMNKLVLLQLRT
jgi:transient receptor potential cation channel subfamily V protein 6